MIESQTKLPIAEPSSQPSGARGNPVTPGDPAAAELQTADGIEGARQSSHLVQTATRVFRRLLAIFTVLIRSARSEAEPGRLLNRYALHLVVLLLALAVVIVSQVRIPSIDFILPAPVSYAEEEEEPVVGVLTTTLDNRPIVHDSAMLFYLPVPHTTIPERYTTEIVTYTVQPNDTVWGIAQAYGIEVETIMWANAEVEKYPDLLGVGQILTILPVNGVYYTVKAGDTVDKLAKTYKTTKEKIVGLELNGLVEPYTLATGQKLVLVDGQKPLPKPKAPLDFGPLQYVGTAPKGSATGSGQFMWPTRGYWSRGLSRYHKGADIANSIGTPIYAADSGYVMMAGRDTYGYGLQIVINHGNGFHTRYAHLSKILVKAGQSVKRGDKIALMGNTGRSTGPHLHFEIIKNGVCINPLSYLPR